MKFSKFGFSLTELMITVAIVAILAAVAYPAYTSQIRRSHRAEGRDMLLQIQLAQEKYFLSNNAYGALADLNSPTPIPGLVSSAGQYYTANGYYQISFTSQTSTTYTAQADSVGSQDNDSHCDKFWITETGNKTATSSDCWNK
ncbi:MAG TPA: type IV pilin protein [Steroidobacteraceae bacterium]|nr:type IV pilin protein [Steroidobacteraceae bacterium]